MIRHVVMWELHDAANAESFRNALLPCAQLVEGQRGYEAALRKARHLLDYEVSDEAHTVEAAELSLVV